MSEPCKKTGLSPGLFSFNNNLPLSFSVFRAFLVANPSVCGWLENCLAEKRVNRSAPPFDKNNGYLGPPGDLFGNIPEQQVSKQRFFRCSGHDQITALSLLQYGVHDRLAFD
jgi:hypothetical protein